MFQMSTIPNELQQTRYDEIAIKTLHKNIPYAYVYWKEKIKEIQEKNNSSDM
jgi:hypothetical protein